MISLSSLLSACDLVLPDGTNPLITSIVQHSAHCTPGSLFFAFEGLSVSGRSYVQEAVARGAVAVVSEGELSDAGVPVIQISKARSLYSMMNAALYGNPERSLKIIGITGTDGKSTTCDYLYQLLKQKNYCVGLLSTIAIDDGSGRLSSPWRQSTPEAELLFPFLARCRDNGVEYLVLECTSHALSDTYDRLGPISYIGAIVPTVTSEHLDFHKSKAEYLNAKLNLARRITSGGFFVSTITNEALSAFLQALDPSVSRHILGQDYHYSISRSTGHHIAVTLDGVESTTNTTLEILGSNMLLAVLALAVLLRRQPTSLVGEVASLIDPKGRMERVENTLGLTIYIDFAHTPDSYRILFASMRSIKADGRLIVVAGAAGNRDRSKRPEMGRIASLNSDVLILTEEDSRGESMSSIFNDLREGIDDTTCRIHEIADRYAAIKEAITCARAGDTILLLGKGHEETIQRGTTTIAWNEREAVEEALRAKELAT
jgi:UDP-N-acetylmuramoyl-L-alanyl-D-glutamate--2,6-diaminopimelate ligase